MTPNHYAYIKIAEGCDNGCSFCSIPIMRGLQKSRTVDSILWEAEKLVESGVKELLIIAQDSTSYGWDLNPKVYYFPIVLFMSRFAINNYKIISGGDRVMMMQKYLQQSM